MPTAKRERSVHIRLTDEADAALEFLAESMHSDKAKVAADLIHRCLLGEVHALTVAAKRYLRSGESGKQREPRPTA